MGDDLLSGDKILIKITLLLICIVNISFATQINLTQKEKQWIIKHPIIKVQSMNDSSPYNFIKDGKPQGYSLDYVKLVASKVGLDVDIVVGNSWNESIELLKNNQIDIMPNIVKTKTREEYFAFTSTYFTVMNTLFTKKDFHPKNLNDLNSKTLSIVRGYSEVEYLKKLYPKIKLYYVDNEIEAFKMLSLDKVDATINNIGVGSEILFKNGLSNIVPTIEIKDKVFQIDIHLATNKDNKQLRDILEKGLNALSPKEKLTLQDKWLTPLLNQDRGISNTLLAIFNKIDYQYLKLFLIVFLIVILVSLYFLKKLSLANKNLEKLQKKLKKQKDEFEILFTHSKDAIAILDMDSKFLEVNQAYCEMTGFSKDELLSRYCYDLTVDKDKEPSKVAIQEVVNIGFIKNFEKDCILKDGSIIHTNMSMSFLPNPSRILISVRDITKQKESMEQFEYLFDNTLEGIILSVDGIITDINQAGLNIFNGTNIYSVQRLFFKEAGTVLI